MSNGTNLAAVSGLLGWAVFRALTNRSIAAAAQAVGYPSTHCLPTETGGPSSRSYRGALSVVWRCHMYVLGFTYSTLIGINGTTFVCYVCMVLCMKQ